MDVDDFRRFLSNLSHELQQPLSKIIGYSNLLRLAKDATDPQREALEIISTSSKQILNLLDDVQAFAAMDDGGVQLNEAAFDLGELARSVDELMSPVARAKGLSLVVDGALQASCVVTADDARLREILIKLVEHAIKCSEEGCITIRASVKGDPECLAMEVQDTGLDLQTPNHQRIFEPFAKIGAEGSAQRAGLELAIAHQLTQLMGGQIGVESAPGSGTLFRVDLPLSAAGKNWPAGDRPPCSSDVELLDQRKSEFRVLVVDDYVDNQNLLEHLMIKAGVQVQTAGSGKEAVDVFRAWHPHLIWMDQKMPVMDGIEATKIIRALPGGDRVKIIGVTASVFQEQRQQIMDAGMDDLVRKPYRFNEIYDCMSRYLGAKFEFGDGT